MGNTNPSIPILGALLIISCSYKLVASSRSFGCVLHENASLSYQNNLNLLFSDFISKSSKQGFYNTSIGTSPDDTVFGYYMCRGDLKPETCKSCIVKAIDFAQGSICLKQKAADFLSSECIFRYSNQSMYGVYENFWGWTTSPLGMNISTYNQSYYQVYNRTLTTTIDALIEEASSTKDDGSDSLSGFATTEVNVKENEKIYGLAQCTPDIVGVNCSHCLKKGFSDLQTYVNGYEGAEFATHNCLLIYNNKKFYDNNDD